MTSGFVAWRQIARSHPPASNVGGSDRTNASTAAPHRERPEDKALLPPAATPVGPSPAAPTSMATLTVGRKTPLGSATGKSSCEWCLHRLDQRRGAGGYRFLTAARGRSPWSPCPHFTVVYAECRRSAANERPTSSISLHCPGGPVRKHTIVPFGQCALA
jgi:hypothetical protein